MSKPTPGPWTFVPEKLYQGQHVAGRGPTITAKNMTIRFSPEHEAEAILVSAAPDLLEALKAVLNEYREGYGLHCIEQVRTAIAKAEGKDHD